MEDNQQNTTEQPPVNIPGQQIEPAPGRQPPANNPSRQPINNPGPPQQPNVAPGPPQPQSQPNYNNYQGNGGNPQPAQTGNPSGLAIAGLVLSILAVVSGWIPILNWFSILPAVLGLVFGIIVRKKKRPADRAFSLVAIVMSSIALVIIVVTTVLIGVVFKHANDSLKNYSGENTQKLLKNEVKVKIGKFHTTTDKYGISTSELPVTVTNKKNTKQSYFITIEAVGAGGNRIDSDSQSASRLSPGESTTLKFFEFVDKNELVKLQSATFKVQSASESSF